MKSQKIDYCRVCKNNILVKVLDLGKQPLANLFLKNKEDLEEKYPLDVYLCENCGHLQLGTLVDREGIFSDYIYFSAPNPTLSTHFQKYANDIKKRIPTWQNDLVVEIGSNDGILLKEFDFNGKNILGIDPAENILASVPTLREFFTEETAHKIVAQKGKAKIIMANNVVAHTFDLHDMLLGMKHLLHDDGLIVVEAPWLGDMFQNNAYDTIYHEHLSYFSITAIAYLFSLFGLVMVDLEFHPVQGNSFRAFFKKVGKGEVSEKILETIKTEKAKGWHKKESYVSLAKSINQSKIKLLNKLKKLKAKGKIIAGYGAPAKGNTIINFTECGEHLDSLMDDMPSKIGFYAPGSRLKIFRRSEVKPDVFVMFAWNYKDHILAKEKDFKGEWIIPNQL